MVRDGAFYNAVVKDGVAVPRSTATPLLLVDRKHICQYNWSIPGMAQQFGAAYAGEGSEVQRFV